MLEEIDRMRRLLEKLLETHDIKDKEVLEVSQKLDKLILRYHQTEYNDSKPNINDEEEIYFIKTVI